MRILTDEETVTVSGGLVSPAMVFALAEGAPDLVVNYAAGAVDTGAGVVDTGAGVVDMATDMLP